MPRDNAAKDMTFIADAMLGRLARWLRLMGFDVLYFKDIEDRALIKVAREQGRTVLTRDSHFLKQKAYKDYIFIKSDKLCNQLLEIRDRFDFRELPTPSRCTACNGLLDRLSAKKDISGAVPEFIYHNFNDFIKCRDCDKVYWEGTHLDQIKGRISDILTCTDVPRRREKDSED